MKIKEVIIVEGKDDISKVKAALDAEVISTNGFGYNKDFIETLKDISKRQGLIIFTDPDYVGEQIRRDISSQIPNCKHAFLSQKDSIKDGDIGIENASLDNIRESIKKARPNKREKQEVFTQGDLINFGLIGKKESKDLRDKLGHELGIGYGNGKQFLSRLNSFDISKEEFIKALERIK